LQERILQRTNSRREKCNQIHTTRLVWICYKNDKTKGRALEMKKEIKMEISIDDALDFLNWYNTSCMHSVLEDLIETINWSFAGFIIYNQNDNKWEKIE
jgi:hypothetical protein